MADISSLDSNLPWLWIIEYLSRFNQVDTNILHDLIVRAPDLPDELTKNTRERVALRCLEELFDPAAEVTSDVTPRVCFDHSQSCEDVLQQILEESSISELKSTSSELLKWDLHPFIVHKRATMPKSASEELKDTIRSSSHPYAAALREISGLTHNNEPAGVPVRDGNHNALAPRVLEGSSNAQTVPERSYVVPPLLKKSNRMSQHELCKRNALPSKRRGCKLATENLMGFENGDQDNLFGCDDLQLNAKKLKQSVDQVSNPLLLKDASERVVAATEVDEMQQNSNPCETRVDTSHPSEDNMINSDGKFEKERENITIKKSHFLSSQCALSQDPLGTAGWTEQNLCVKCNKAGQMLVCTTSGCPLVVHESCLGFPARFDDSGNFYCPFCAYSVSISKYIEAKKRVSLAKQELSAFIHAVDLCSKERAEGHGKEHRHSRTEQEEFGLPTLFRDVSSQCIGDEAYEVRIQEKGHLREKEQNPACQNGEDVNCRFQRNLTNQQQLGPSMSGRNVNTPVMEGERYILNETVCVPNLEIKGKVKVVKKHRPETEAEDDNNGDFSSYNTESVSVNGQEAEGVNKKEVLNKHATDDRSETEVEDDNNGDSSSYNTEHASVNEQEAEGVNRKEVLEKHATDDRSETEAEYDNKGDSSSYNTEPASANEQEAEGVNKKKLLNKHATDADQHPLILNFSGEGASDDKFIISKFCTRLRNRDIKHTHPAIPQTRRPSVPWTAEEEEVLRKGVAKFANRADGITPWKDILEFGESVFHSCRTPRNLKEKWRTICRRRQ